MHRIWKHAVIGVSLVVALSVAGVQPATGGQTDVGARIDAPTSFALHDDPGVHRAEGNGGPPKQIEGNGGPPKPKKEEKKVEEKAEAEEEPAPEPPEKELEPPPPPPPRQPEPKEPVEPVYERADVEEYEEVAPGCPFSFSLNYTLVSDYVFRGINFSEYPTEGREKPNHQLTTDMSFDLAQMVGQEQGQYGVVTFSTFFEWFAAQKQLDPEDGGQNLQEVDYVVSWAYDIESIATTFAVGWTFYAFPNAKSINTHEWWFSLEHNDAWMWKWLFPENEDGILNPSFFLAHDLEIARGVWMELGFYHDFALFQNFTLTPSVVLSVDHRYLDPLSGSERAGSTRFAYAQYGLAAAYDLTPLLHLPDWIGSVTVSGFLNYQDPFDPVANDRLIGEELYGGVSVGWSWGG